MRIAIVHYSAPPVIGGVEEVIGQHARLFAESGHEVTVICGDGTGTCVAELGATHPDVVAAQADEIAFRALEARLVEKLRGLLREQEIVFVHNVLHMPFNLALTSALVKLAAELTGVRFVSWIHDLAAINPDYTLGASGPWTLLRQASPKFEYVAVSALRQRQFCELTGCEPARCAVIPNGIDPAEFLQLTRPVAELARSQRILERDLVLFHPARLLKRKNVELGLRVTSALARRGIDVMLLLTAAPEPHSRTSAEYRDELRELEAGLGIESRVIRVGELFAVTRRDLISLYALADALFYPSRQEGFGLPLLEAALIRLPAVAVELDPMRIISPEAIFVRPDGDPEGIAAALEARVINSPSVMSRKRTVREYSWESIREKHLNPLLARLQRK